MENESAGQLYKGQKGHLILATVIWEMLCQSQMRKILLLLYYRTSYILILTLWSVWIQSN